MSEKDKHMSLYTSSDIEKYLSGELSDPEMHALERAALDDPFLADALEGMALHQSLPEHPAFRQDMAGLQKRLEERVSSGKKGRVRHLPPVVRYAAAVLLLLGLGVTGYYMLFNKKMKAYPLADRPVEVEKTTPAVTSSPGVATRDSSKLTLSDGAIAHYEIEPSLKKTAARANKSKPTVDTTLSSEPLYFSSNKDRESNNNVFSKLAKQPNAPSYSNTTSNANNFELSTTPQKPVIFDTLILYRDTTLYKYRSPAGVKAESPPLAFSRSSDQLVFRGKVINPQHIPLAGATLSVKGDRYFVTTTDKDGYFTLKLPKKDSVQRVLVNYVGYEQGYTALNTDDKQGNIILLKPQSLSLNEVVIVGYGAKRKEVMQTNINALPLPLSKTAVPAEGWPAYNNYLELNKRSPQVDTILRGYESISFIVNKKGELSSFKVEQSLSPSHDSLSIRLIKDGPPWKLLKGKKEKARVILTW